MHVNVQAHTAWTTATRRSLARGRLRPCARAPSPGRGQSLPLGTRSGPCSSVVQAGGPRSFRERRDLPSAGGPQSELKAQGSGYYQRFGRDWRRRRRGFLGSRGQDRTEGPANQLGTMRTGPTCRFSPKPARPLAQSAGRSPRQPRTDSVPPSSPRQPNICTSQARTRPPRALRGWAAPGLGDLLEKAVSLLVTQTYLGWKMEEFKGNTQYFITTLDVRV